MQPITACNTTQEAKKRQEIPPFAISLRSMAQVGMTLAFMDERGLDGATRHPAPSPSLKKHLVISKPLAN